MVAIYTTAQILQNQIPNQPSKSDANAGHIPMKLTPSQTASIQIANQFLSKNILEKMGTLCQLLVTITPSFSFSQNTFPHEIGYVPPPR